MVNGRKIKELREAADVSQTRLASRVGSSQTMISYVEDGLKQPSVTLLGNIAAYFGVRMDDLLIKKE